MLRDAPRIWENWTTRKYKNTAPHKFTPVKATEFSVAAHEGFRYTTLRDKNKVDSVGSIGNGKLAASGEGTPTGQQSVARTHLNTLFHQHRLRTSSLPINERNFEKSLMFSDTNAIYIISAFIALLTSPPGYLTRSTAATRRSLRAPHHFGGHRPRQFPMPAPTDPR